MTTEMPEQDRDATASAVYYIENNKNIERLIHDMLHTCKTVEEYTDKLAGLLRIFWGESTPDNKNMDKVIWIDVIVQILPIKCLIPLFKNSMLKLEGKEITDEETQEHCNR